MNAHEKDAQTSAPEESSRQPDIAPAIAFSALSDFQVILQNAANKRTEAEYIQQSYAA